MSEPIIYIPGRIKNIAIGGHVAGVEDIYDDTKGKTQQEINFEIEQSLGDGGSVDERIIAAKEEIIGNATSACDTLDKAEALISAEATARQLSINNVIGDAASDYNTLGKLEAKIKEEVTRAETAEGALDGRIDTLEDTVGTGGDVDSRISTAVATETTRAQAAEADRYTKSETYTKEEVHNLITTPSQEYVSVTATDQTTSIIDVLPATGVADTIYRVGNWDGTQYNDSVFTEYAWNGSDYIELSTKSQIGEVYDISANHADTKYADLAAALGTNGANVPQSLRKGGMSVKFVQSSDNNYVQFRCIADEFTTDTTQWAICDEGVYVENSEFAEVKLDSENKIIWAVKTDGTIYYGAGVPQQVVNYIDEKIAELSLDEYEDIVAFLNDLEKGDKTLQTLLDEKVDKEEGKSLIDEEYAEGVYHIENSEFVTICLDKDDKILFGVQVDGNFLFGCGVPKQIVDFVNSIANNKVDKVEGKSLINSEFAASQSVVENSKFMDVEIDSEYKILGGRKIDGTKFENLPIETPATIIESVDNPEWVEVKTDKNGKIIEGIKTNKGKYISSFDRSTQKTIKEFSENVYIIPQLDANFSTPLKYKIYNGNVEYPSFKGNENAKYVFNLPVGDSWIVRFKFRITENLLNQNKDANIASIGNAKIIAKTFPLTQHQETYTYNGEDHVEHWPTVDGGIAFNRNEINNFVYGRNIGQQAFSVRYIGEGDDVTLENDGNGLILIVDGTEIVYSFANYDSMSELFEAMANNTDLELQYIALDQRACNELAIFSAVKLKDTFYTKNGNYSDPIAPHIDNAPFYLYYAISDKWHQAEILKIGAYIYSVCDGNVISTIAEDDISELVLGGDCSVLFKDFMFCGDSTLDAEYINGKIVSSSTPSIIVFEGHDLFNGPSYTVTPEETAQGMSSLNPDALEYFYSVLDKKGYVPVTLDDIYRFLVSGNPIPKRCYTMIFDDYQFDICLDLERRSVFKRHGTMPNLAIITSYYGEHPIYHNGEIITFEKAVDICRLNGFGLVSHTATHRNVPRGCKPSDYLFYFRNDIIDADKKNVDGCTLVYPGGWSNVYSHDVMEYAGFKLGIEITLYANRNVSHSRFNLSRVNIGTLIDTQGNFYNYSMYTNQII